MKKVPYNIAFLTDDHTWERITIGKSEAETYLLKGSNRHQYLKIQPITSTESLSIEREKLAWLQTKLPVPEVIHYEKDEVNEYLLLSELTGNDASSTSDNII